MLQKQKLVPGERTGAAGTRRAKAMMQLFRENNPDDVPVPPGTNPGAPVEEPPDPPVNQPDAPVREPGPEPPPRL